LSFLFLLAGLLSLFVADDGYAQTPQAENLQAQAMEQGLAESRYWQILLHYKADIFGEPVSLVDDPRFFLDPQGKVDPRAELDATLSGLWQPQNEAKPEDHVRCRFPARSQWLMDELALDSAQLPPVTCPQLDETLTQIEPRSALLIFPGNHNNSPASMFGHTLIAIEGPYKSRLLTYAVNYAAHTDETNGFAYAFKGIFGLYSGFYSLLPYYVKTREYNDLERRDVWEYQLNLTAAETRRMTLHIWELRNIASAYFFFDENCSYNLLFLLEAARPSLNLTDPCRPWVVPIDTVRIVDQAGLIEQVAYRPSKATRIMTLAKEMNQQETALALQLIEDQTSAVEVLASAVPREGKIRILDVASETLEFRYYRDEIDRELYRKKSLELLRNRSQLGKAPQGYLEIADPGRPDQGHGSNRLALGLGLAKEEWYQELRIRPAYHNLLDADQGYLPGSQIDFANLFLRYTPEHKRLRLQRLDLIDIVSLSPRHAFYQPVSWKVTTGLRRVPFADRDDHLVYQLNPGSGFTWGNNRSMAYALFETDLMVSGRFRDSFTAGAGGSLGLLFNPLPAWKMHLRARNIWYLAGEDRHRRRQIELSQNLRLTANASLVFEIGQQRSFEHTSTEASLLVNLYW